jgi:hypothetical protein
MIMPTIVNPANRIKKGGFISNYFKRVMTDKLPRRLKRLIYISSIMGLIQQVKEPDMSLVNKLNEVFKIAKHPDAFIFPMYIKSIIWRDAVSVAILAEDNRTINIGNIVQCDLTTRDCKTIGEHFAANAPSWLKYGSEALMINDVITLVSQLKKFDHDSLAAA